jgi:hypothetical protein
MATNGSAGMTSHGVAALGWAWIVLAAQRRPRKAWPGRSRFGIPWCGNAGWGNAGIAGTGSATLGLVGWREVGHRRRCSSRRGPARIRPDIALQRRRGYARRGLGLVWLGSATQAGKRSAWHGFVRLRSARIGTATQAGQRRQGTATQRNAGKARCGPASPRWAACGVAWQRRRRGDGRGWDRFVPARLRRRGVARRGSATQGTSTQRRRGAAWLGKVWQRRAWQRRHGAT